MTNICKLQWTQHLFYFMRFRNKFGMTNPKLDIREFYNLTIQTKFSGMFEAKIHTCL